MKNNVKNLIVKNGRQSLHKLHKKGVYHSSKSDILKIKIQAIEPWKRIVIFNTGIISEFIMLISIIYKGPLWIVIVFGFFGFTLILFGIVGKKKTIDQMLQGIDGGVTTNIVAEIIDAIF